MEQALANQQWFGKIGTSPDDMKAALYTTHAQILDAQNAHLSTRVPLNLFEQLAFVRQKISNALQAWWSYRKARQLLVEKLNEFEDMYIRHTDSMLEYTTLGDVLATFRPHTLKRHRTENVHYDKREYANAYYDSYLAQSYAKHGDTANAYRLWEQALSKMREPAEGLLKVHALLQQAHLQKRGSTARSKAVLQAFELSPSSVRNEGLRLPVVVKGGDAILDTLQDSAFLPLNSGSLPYRIEHSFDGKLHFLKFVSATATVRDMTVQSESLIEAVNGLAESIFKRESQLVEDN